MRLGATLVAVAGFLAAGCGGVGSEGAREGKATAVDMEDTPTETATPVVPDGGSPTQCGGSHWPDFDPFQQYFLKWAPDASLIMYDDFLDVFVVSTDTLDVVYETQIARGLPRFRSPTPRFGAYADFRTGGPDIVFATCLPLDEGKSGGESWPASDYFYDLVVVEAKVGEDGSWEYSEDGELRLTTNSYFEHYPVWSPDGTQIAFLASTLGPRKSWEPEDMKLFVMNSDGSGVRMLAARPEGVALFPVVWARDGSSVMFLVNEGGGDLGELVPYWVGLEGEAVERVQGDEAIVALSPSGATVARGDGNDGHLAVSIMNSEDGTVLQRFDLPDKGQTAKAIRQLAWSPDETELLAIVGKADPTGERSPGPSGMNVLAHGMYVLDISSGAVRTLLGEEEEGLEYRGYLLEYTAAWSPDGAHIAVRGDLMRAWEANEKVVVVFIVARDGTDLRMLVDWR